MAFSREGSQKDYVQHHIEREPKLVAPLLREGPETQGIFYICGDAKNMAKVSITFSGLWGCVWRCFSRDVQCQGVTVTISGTCSPLLPWL